MIELTIPSLLNASSTVTAITGPRIYPLTLPTDVTLPAIHYSIVTGVVSPTFNSNGSQRFRVAINCRGNTYGEAIILRAAVVTALNRYRDGTTSVQYIGPRDLFDDQLLQYRAVAEFYFFTSNF